MLSLALQKTAILLPFYGRHGRSMPYAMLSQIMAPGEQIFNDLELCWQVRCLAAD